MSYDRAIVDAIKVAQNLLWQSTPPTHNLSDAATVLRFRELVRSPAVRSALGAAATCFWRLRCERSSVCFPINR
jgi:hypothetical protein